MSAQPAICWHCGEALLAGRVLHASVAGQSRAVCCQGCRAAAEWIEQLGLADFYRLRTQPSEKPRELTDDHDLWRRPENARHVVRDLGAGQHEVLLSIAGMRCSACVWLIEHVLTALPGVVIAQISPVSQRGRIVWRSSAIDLPTLLQALERAGYAAMPLDARGLHDARRNESRGALKRLLVAGFGTMQAMMYATAVYLGNLDSLDVSTQALLRWMQFLVAIPVVFYSAQPFFAGAATSLRLRKLGMDVPIAIAIAAVFAASLIETLRGGGEVYFDSISMFVFFLLTSRYLEMRARHRAGDLTDALAKLTPAFADRCRADGAFERVGVHELRAGDHVHIREGGIVPADGQLLSARCHVNESLLSGESSSVLKTQGARLIAGSVLEDGPAQLRVERVGEDTALAGIALLVARAQAERPQLQRAGEQATARFVTRVLTLTALTIVSWIFIDPSRAFSAAIAVLVVSCPCAFALAVSATITRALAALAHRGVLVVKPDAIEALAGCTRVVFDKTGTLTRSAIAPADIQTFNGADRNEALRLAASMARYSRHPIARAIAEHTDGSPADVRDVVAHTGFGLSATLGEHRLRLGRYDFALPDAPIASEHEDAVLLADETGLIASFQVREQLKPEASAAIDALREQGLNVSIASGDANAKVSLIAKRLHIEDWRARMLPAAKLNWLAELRSRGERILVVGDGVNDAPALAGADVSIALSDGADLAHASSDIVLLHERLGSIAAARAIAQQALAIVRQNQRWALLYNLTAMPLAALGFVPAWLAAIGMSLSSLGVVLNALRIGRDIKLPRAVPSTHSRAVPQAASTP